MSFNASTPNQCNWYLKNRKLVLLGFKIPNMVWKGVLTLDYLIFFLQKNVQHWNWKAAKNVENTDDYMSSNSKARANISISSICAEGLDWSVIPTSTSYIYYGVFWLHLILGIFSDLLQNYRIGGCRRNGYYGAKDTKGKLMLDRKVMVLYSKFTYWSQFSLE